MVTLSKPYLLIILGGILIVLGFGAIFGIVLRLWQSTFALNFLAYIASMVGLLLSLLGVFAVNQRDRY